MVQTASTSRSTSLTVRRRISSSAHTTTATTSPTASVIHQAVSLVDRARTVTARLPASAGSGRPAPGRRPELLGARDRGQVVEVAGDADTGLEDVSRVTVDLQGG